MKLSRMEVEERKRYIDALQGVGWNGWNELVNEIKGEYGESALVDIADSATGKAERLGEIAAYLNQRGGDGTGDHGHEKAIEYMNKQRKKIRKGLGYTTP